MSVTLLNILNRFLFAPPAGPSSRVTSSLPAMLIPSGVKDFINHHNTLSENKRELVSGFY